MSPCDFTPSRHASRGVINARSPRRDPRVKGKGKKRFVAGWRVVTSNVVTRLALDTAADTFVSPWHTHVYGLVYAHAGTYTAARSEGLGFGSLRACKTYKLPVLRIPPYTGHTSLHTRRELHMRLRRRRRRRRVVRRSTLSIALACTRASVIIITRDKKNERR